MVETNNPRLLQNHIDGRWITPTAADFLDVQNPSDGRVLASVPLSCQADVDQAVAAARGAFRAWSRRRSLNAVALFEIGRVAARELRRPCQADY